jgi:hypothetical protein
MGLLVHVYVEATSARPREVHCENLAENDSRKQASIYGGNTVFVSICHLVAFSQFFPFLFTGLGI